MASRSRGPACRLALLATALLACVANGALLRAAEADGVPLPASGRLAQAAAAVAADPTDGGPTIGFAPDDGSEAGAAALPGTTGNAQSGVAKPRTDSPTPTGKTSKASPKAVKPAGADAGGGPGPNGGPPPNGAPGPNGGPPPNGGPGGGGPTPAGPASLTLGPKSAGGADQSAISLHAPGGLLHRLGLFQGLEITGSNSYTLQRNSVEGAEDAFSGQRWDTGNTVRQSSLHLEGPIWRQFGFQADFSSTGYGPSYSRIVYGFVTKNTGLYYGDLNVQLGGNEFAQFSKSLKGWQLDQRLPHNGLLRAFESQEKGFVRNQSFRGNNTSGPYFLSYTPVVDGSEVVKIDERAMKLGKDYRLDYDTGQLYFETVDNPATIVPATSTISVSYQSSGYQDSPGSLSGWRLEMPMVGDKLLVGVTDLAQKRSTGGSGHRDTANYQEDVYNGSGSTGPFDTNFRPILANGATVVYKSQTITIAQPLTVLVDAVEQKEAIDYDSYRQIGRVIFRRAVPPTSLVVIRYYYSVAQTFTSGDQDVQGVDLSYRISKDLSLRTDYAHSTGGTSGGEGSAITTSLTLTKPKYRIAYNYRNMDPTFSYIDSVGFRSLEKGSTLSMEWRPKPWLSLHNTRATTMSATGSSFGYSGYGGGYGFGSGTGTSAFAQIGVAQTGTNTTSSSLGVANTRNDFGVQLNVPKWPSVDYSVQSMTNGGTSSLGGSDYTTTNIRSQWSPAGKPYSISWQSTSNDQAYSGLSGNTGTTGTAKGSSTKQSQTSFTYNPGTKLSLTASLGKNSSTDSTGTSNSSASNKQYTLRYTPSERLSFSFDRTLSESVGLVSSGFFSNYTTSTTGTTTIGNISGSTSTTTGDGTTSSAGTQYTDDSTRFMVNWQPARKLTLNYSTMHRTYTSSGSVGYLADSDQTNQTVGLSLQLSEAMSLTGGWSRDNMRFLDANRGTVASNMLTLGANYKRANSRWGVGLNYTQQVGSSPTYINFGAAQIMRIVPTSLHDLEGRLTFDTGPRSSLYATMGMSDFDSGYSAFEKQTSEMGWAYKVSGLTNLTVGYRYIRNLNTLSASGLPGYYGSNPAGQDYIANTFLMTLSTNFHTGLGGSEGPPSASAAFMPGSGSFGGTSTFGGYRAGIGGFNGYGAGTTATNINGYSGGLGSTFGTGNTYGGFGSSSSSLGGFGTTGQFGSSSLGGFGTTGIGTTPPSYGTGFYSSTSNAGFKTGLGDFQQKTSDESGTTSSGTGNTFPSPSGQMPGGQGPRGQGPPGGPGAPGAAPFDMNAPPDWQLLDDGRSRWW